MIRILIVDDERWVAESIKESIDWSKNDYELVGLANDGVEALEIIKEMTPDIVITDIRMPRMSGLELINFTNSLKLDIKFIIVSVFAEFSYAQKALSYGAAGYCLKPINKYELNELLDNLKKVIITKKLKEETVIFDSLLSNSPENLESTKGIFINKGIYCDEKHGIILCSSIGKTCIEINDFRYITLKLSIDKYVYVIQYDDRLNLKELLHSKLCDNITSIGISRVVYKIEDLSVCIEEANIAALQYFITSGKDVYEYHKIEKIRLKEYIVNLNKAFLVKDKSLIKEIYNQLDGIFKTAPYNIKQAFWVYNSIINNIFMYVEEDKENYLYNFQQLVERYSNVSEMLQFLLTLTLLQLNVKSEDEHKKIENETMSNILEYVDKNFCSDISIQDLSQRFYVNPNYISQLFKKELGKSFTEYLTNLRVRYACELLSNSELSLQNVADKTGYNDYFYFSKVFKKIIGKTPSKYREDVTNLSK